MQLYVYVITTYGISRTFDKTSTLNHSETGRLPTDNFITDNN